MADDTNYQVKDSIGRVEGGFTFLDTYPSSTGYNEAWYMSLLSLGGYIYFVDVNDEYPNTNSYRIGGYGNCIIKRHVTTYYNGNFNSDYNYEYSLPLSNNFNNMDSFSFNSFGDYDYSTLNTTIPIFSRENTEAIQRYIETGDTSGARNKDMLDLSAIWTKVYLDGSKPPNITITWGSESGDKPEHVNVVVYATPTYGAEEGKTELSRTLYSWGDSGVSFTWGSLENLMYGGDVPSIIIETNSKSSVNNISTAYVDSDGKNYQPSEKTLSNDGKNSIQVVVGEVPSDEDNSDQKEEEKSEADEKEENTNINTASLLTRTYQLTREQLQSLGNFLWGDSFLNNIKLINNSPIENVVSVKAIPCDFLTDASTNIVLGNVATTVQGNPVTNNYIKKTIGTIKVSNQDNSSIDYQDCDILLYSPLIGTITDLNPREVMGYTITLKYCYDAITGDVIAELFNNRAGKENIIGVYRGNCGVDIPLTSSNRAQVEAGYISDTISGVASIVSKNPLGVVNAGMSALTRMHTSHSTGSVSGATAQGLPNKAYLTIITSLPQKVTKVFRHTYGRVCCNNHKLGDLNGYTMCDDKIDLSSISCTETEKEEIRLLLANGVYL